MLANERLRQIAESQLCDEHGEGVRCGVCDGILAARECLDLRAQIVRLSAPTMQNESTVFIKPVLSTQPCVSCGKQTVYKCPWDKTVICREIACREAHEATGNCALPQARISAPDVKEGNDANKTSS